MDACGISELCELLKNSGISDNACEILKKQEISGPLFLKLTTEELKEMNLTMGQRKKLQEIQEQNVTPPTSQVVNIYILSIRFCSVSCCTLYFSTFHIMSSETYSHAVECLY